MQLQERREGARVGLVLSGGGARGAYDAGVLSYVYGPLARRLGFIPRIDIYSGASVGAVHTCYLAAHVGEADGGTVGLCDIWQSMAFDGVYRFTLSDALSFASTVLSSAWGVDMDSTRRPDRLQGLLNTAPLERLVVEKIPWRRLRSNLRQGLLEAVSTSVTEISSGRTVVFVDNRDRTVPSWTRDPLQVAVPDRMSPRHALASAAIPLLFPAVRIRDDYYADGSLRQHTALTPALRLGANRLLVVGLRAPPSIKIDRVLAAERVEKYRSMGFLLGKLLNALLIDRLDYDMSHMRALNRALRAGQEAYGPEFLNNINPHVEQVRGLGFQVVEDCFVRPSKDLGQIAAQHVQRLRVQPGGSWIGNWTFRALTRGAPKGEADMMSFLLFDAGYARELIELGRRDAEANEEHLARLFLE